MVLLDFKIILIKLINNTNNKLYLFFIIKLNKYIDEYI